MLVRRDWPALFSLILILPPSLTCVGKRTFLCACWRDWPALSGMIRILPPSLVQTIGASFLAKQVFTFISPITLIFVGESIAGWDGMAC